MVMPDMRADILMTDIHFLSDGDQRGVNFQASDWSD